MSVIVPGAGPGGRDLRRAYSIASSPENSVVELCVKYVEGGPGTTYLKGLKVGDPFRGLAPYGDFIYRTSPERVACFISTGTGIAPFRSMVLSEAFRSAPPREALCLLGVRSEDEILYDREMGAVRGLRWVTAVSQPQAPRGTDFRGRVTDYLRQADLDWHGTDFYLCGNGAMIAEVKALLTERGVEKPAIHQEKYY